MSALQKFAIVIVTYKRQDLLQVLFDSIAQMYLLPSDIVLVDNEASAETEKIAVKFDERLPETAVHYVPMSENTGGAGGFSKGVEKAYQIGSEWFWLMDDDVKVFPQALERLKDWTSDALSNDTRAIQVCRQNYDGTAFYWQYDFKVKLGIPNPVAPSTFSEGESFKKINTMCFEGGLVHRSLVEELGLPDARFFIYWDDTIYGYLASKKTQPILINETLMARTRALDNLKIGRVRKLNATSDLARYYILRNRGYMAQYFKLYGDYRWLAFRFGTLLTFGKELIRLLLSKNFFKGIGILIRGLRDAKKLRKDKTWQPMPNLKTNK